MDSRRKGVHGAEQKIVRLIGPIDANFLFDVSKSRSMKVGWVKVHLQPGENSRNYLSASSSPKIVDRSSQPTS